MIHKTRNQVNVGHSVVALGGGVKRVFAVAVPARGGRLSEQAEDVLQMLRRLFQDSGGGSIVMQSIFLRDAADRVACRRIVEDCFGKDLPATAYIVQPPCDGSLLSIEAWAVESCGGKVEIERVDEQVAVAEHNGCRWAYVAGIHAENQGSVYDRSLRAFQLVHQRLGIAGLQFDDVIRTWLYLGDITGLEGKTRRYCELNRARSEFYRNRKFGDNLVPAQCDGRVFPASTGIGAVGDEMAMGCIALQTGRADVLLVPLENPRQMSSCDYGRSYGPESPKFARAMAVVADGCATTFISGTASITASETRHIADVRRQMQQSLDNIEALIAGDNFRRHGLPGPGATLADLAVARVYVRRQEDYADVKEICQAQLGELPIVYALADVCRPELLVEIEGVAFCNC